MPQSSLFGYRLVLLLVGASFPAASTLAAEPRIAGPVAADIVKVRDGDTVEVEAHIWPQQVVRVAVRLRGIDAPELKARCDAEKTAAIAARTRLTALLAPGGVTLSNISGDKYFGRVLAELNTADGTDVGRALLREGLVVAYGGKTRRDWCKTRPTPHSAGAATGHAG
ncbi:hypothetical protein Sa4125_43730 [Aureimonas sp. SA4125]|uniref:thermonuclease family protein n=1 Tax=Aureimonas sp. SA4125 TaxID=2826993 RepID=UPI001CC4AFF6|nr:thermonuclease family protein [Aureimonas sp. SA4125]BDA86831.1 hypothetical protein Sa4125_43730 [Aureimonas sp. SA4125]